MTVRGAAKNPLPRPVPASMDTIAGIERLTTSSKLSVVATGAIAAPGAPGAIGASGAPGASGALGLSAGLSAVATCEDGAKADASGATDSVAFAGVFDLTGITWRAMRPPAATTATTP